MISFVKPSRSKIVNESEIYDAIEKDLLKLDRILDQICSVQEIFEKMTWKCFNFYFQINIKEQVIAWSDRSKLLPCDKSSYFDCWAYFRS